MTDLWTRRPTVVSVDDVHDGCVGVLEFADDPDLVDQVATEAPDEALMEGATWPEWEDGSG